MKIEVRPFDRHVPTNRFSCGKRNIDRWFRTNAKKRSDRYEIRIFTAHYDPSTEPVGFYALQIGSESLNALENKPDDWTKNYTSFPAVHLAYLAVDERHQGKGVGTALLTHVFERAYTISECAGLYALTLQSIDEQSTSFYESLGFQRYGGPETHPKMMINIRTIRDLIEGATRSGKPYE